MTLHDGPESVRAERWRYLVAVCTNDQPRPAEATLELEHRSGRRERHRWTVAPLGGERREFYAYAGHPDPPIAAELRLGPQRTRWTLPTAIPPERALLVASSDPGWVPRLGAALTERGVGIELRPTVALPERWLGLRGLAAVAVPRAELPRLRPAQRQALASYARHGGLVLLLAGDAEAAAAAPLDWPASGTSGRGRLLSWSPGTAALPSLAPWPPAPRDSHGLPMARLDAALPLGWLGARAGGWLLAAIGVSLLLRRRPVVGLAALAGLGLLAAFAPPWPGAVAPVCEAVGWTTAAPSSEPSGAPLRLLQRRELRAVPQRSGPVELALPADARTALVGLQPGTPLALELTPGGERDGPPAGGARWSIAGRWGEPVDLLLERDAGDR